MHFDRNFSHCELASSHTARIANALAEGNLSYVRQRDTSEYLWDTRWLPYANAVRVT